MGVMKLLHVGCGSKVNKPPREFGAYLETRLDCSPMVEPDIVASIVAMPMIEDDSYDAIFASHVLEHLHCHEGQMALAEFLRILKPDGVLLLHVPDLQAIGGKIALDELDCGIYNSPLGVITPLDMLYGHRGSVGAGNIWMSHKNGFTAGLLSRLMQSAGFENITTDRETRYELKARGYKCPQKAKCNGSTSTLTSGTNGSRSTISTTEESFQPA